MENSQSEKKQKQKTKSKSISRLLSSDSKSYNLSKTNIRLKKF
jgi:inorganic pyrophosphatase/exopolyphosphatase